MTTLRETWVIAKREFLERVKSKWFIVMTVIWPVLMIAMMVVPALLGGQGTEGAKVQIVDKSGVLGKQIAFNTGLFMKWDAKVVPPDTGEDELNRLIRKHEINGYVWIPKDALDGGEIVYNGDNASNQTVTILFTKCAQSAVVKMRGERAGISGSLLDEINAEVKVDARHTNGEEAGGAGLFVFLIGYMISFLIYMAITLYGIGVMRSIVTEKSDRVVELLVAATKPRAMMSGKILGVGAAGLVQIGIWFLLAKVGMTYKSEILELFGVSGGGGGMSMMPALSTSQLVVVMLCFLFGYLFYSALYAAVGAMVASEQDSQQAQMPITFLLVIGMVAIMAVTNDPHGKVASVMTIVPFWSPMLMPLRYFLGGASGGEVAISITILAASTIVVSRIAAKIYRVGILMYGKRPSLRELVRWVRY
jgi:ABC-2 type transport system permease protein